MRICLLTHAKCPFGYEYAKNFMQRGHEVELFSLNVEPPIMEGVKVRCFGSENFDPSTSRSRWQYLKSILPIRRAVREYKPDILMAMYLSSAGLVATLTGHSRVVLSALGSDVFFKVHSRFWRAMLRWETHHAVLVHVVSEPLAETLKEQIGVPDKKLIVAPIGVDTELLRFIESTERPETGQILCTRGHVPVYDQETLVKAMAILKTRGVSCHLTFTSTRDVDKTKAIVKERRLEDMVTFRNGYSYEELPSLLAAADIYVSASLSDGTSNSLLEAMSTGTFPVVSDIPANRPWINNGKNGFFFPPGDEKALADRLSEALSKPDIRSAAAPLNREIVVTKGDVTHQADKLLAAFGKCLTVDR